MTCAHEYCIYNKKLTCTLENISLDDLGMCQSCTVVWLDEGFLEAEKERQLRELNERWENECGKCSQGEP